MHGLSVYRLHGSKQEVITSTAPATECLHARVARMRLLYESHPRTPIAVTWCLRSSVVPRTEPPPPGSPHGSRFVARVPHAPHARGVGRAPHSRVSLRNGPSRTIPDSLRSPQGFEMRVARPHFRFSTVENRVTSTLRQHISVRPETQGKHSACAVAPSLPDTLAYCAPPRGRPHHRFSTVENRSQQLPAQTCVQASV